MAAATRNPTYLIRTDRLQLRCWSPADAPRLREVLDASAEHLRPLLGETMLLDRVGPKAREIGYWMDTRHCGRGYATEASAAMVRVAFVVDGVERLEIHTSPGNEPSIAVARRLGFSHEATLTARFRDCNDDLNDTMIWTLFAADYPGSAGSQLAVECFDAADRRLDT